MAVLIKDMDMPKDCDSCFMADKCEHRHYELMEDEYGSFVPRLVKDACPLEEIKPMKPKAGTVHFRGVTKDVPVCPECDHMLTPFVFDDEQSEMVTYCEHCGQVIDWSGAKEDWK